MGDFEKKNDVSENFFYESTKFGKFIFHYEHQLIWFFNLENFLKEPDARLIETLKKR